MNIERKALEQHLRNACEWRIMECEYCKQLHPKKNLQVKTIIIQKKTPKGFLSGVTYNLPQACMSVPIALIFQCAAPDHGRTPAVGGGGGELPYMGYIIMCRCEGYGFQAGYSRIGYINQTVWV